MHTAASYHMNWNMSILHDDINKLHVNIIMLHFDIIYLACKGQKYATIYNLLSHPYAAREHEAIC